jgi:hypothetical protein
VTKNKVQKLCLDELKKLDQTLWPHFEDASNIISEAFLIGLEKYKGPAKLPELRQLKDDNDSYQFYIEEVVYLTIYKVKSEKINVK